MKQVSIDLTKFYKQSEEVDLTKIDEQIKDVYLTKNTIEARIYTWQIGDKSEAIVDTTKLKAKLK